MEADITTQAVGLATSADFSLINLIGFATSFKNYQKIQKSKLFLHSR